MPKIQFGVNVTNDVPNDIANAVTSVTSVTFGGCTFKYRK